MKGLALAMAMRLAGVALVGVALYVSDVPSHISWAQAVVAGVAIWAALEVYRRSPQ